MNQSIEELISGAVSLLETEQIERAEIEFRKILKLFPDHHLAVGAMGDFYLRIGRADLALPFLRLLVTMKPNDFLSYFLLGAAYSKVGRFFLAIEAFKKADTLQPNDPEIIRQLGINLGLKGKIEEGRKMLKKVISLDPTSEQAYADLGANYMFNCEYEKAKEYIEKSLSLDPQYLTALQLQEDLKYNEIEFTKLSPIERERRQKEMQSQEHKKQMQINLMMYCFSQMQTTKEDVDEVILELKELGLSGQVTMLHDPNTPEGKAAIEYVEHHKNIPNLDTQKLSLEEIKQIVNKLFNKETNIKEKKDLILILAHQGQKIALQGLKKYAQNPDKELKVWIQLAVDECKTFLAKETLNESVIQIHKIGKDSDSSEEKIL